MTETETTTDWRQRAEEAHRRRAAEQALEEERAAEAARAEEAERVAASVADLRRRLHDLFDFPLDPAATVVVRVGARYTSFHETIAVDRDGVVFTHGPVTATEPARKAVRVLVVCPDCRTTLDASSAVWSLADLGQALLEWVPATLARGCEVCQERAFDAEYERRRAQAEVAVAASAAPPVPTLEEKLLETLRDFIHAEAGGQPDA